LGKRIDNLKGVDVDQANVYCLGIKDVGMVQVGNDDTEVMNFAHKMR
jgi:hypothetical protein